MRLLSSALTVLYFYVLFDVKTDADTITNSTTPTSEQEILEVKEDLNRVWEAIAKLQKHVASTIGTTNDAEVIANLTDILELHRDWDGSLSRVSHNSHLTVHLEGSDPDSTRRASSAIFQISTTEPNYVWHKFVDSVGFAFWHFGSTNVYHLFHSDGHYEIKRLGNVLEDDRAMPMVVIPSDAWYVTEVDPVFGNYVVESKLMAPGWTKDHFIKGEQENIEEMFPQHKRVIEKFQQRSSEELNEID